MNPAILGTSWLTPLGAGADAMERILSGGRPTPETIADSTGTHVFPVFKVPPDLYSDSGKLARLRRSGTISLMAVSAANDALVDAKLHAPEIADDLALVFVASNGGVTYSRKFFSSIASDGTHAGSPLLFPETVYNAPASHIAATLGINGTATTLVGDAAGAILGIEVAVQMLRSDECRYCLVVAAEEADWITCAAAECWKLSRGATRVRPMSGRGTVFAGGAAALLLGASDQGMPQISAVHPGTTHRTLEQARTRHATLLSELALENMPDVVVASMGGTHFDAVEADSIHSAFGPRPMITPKISLGEAFGASALAQVVLAARMAQTARANRIAVSVLGMNSHSAGLSIIRASRPANGKKL